MKSNKHKLKVFAGFPSYGGNGGIQAEVPCVRKWWADTILKIQADPRIEAFTPQDVAHLRDVEITGKVAHITIGDTPVTHVRNKFVTLARKAGADLLLMIDSDQGMLLHKNDPGHVDFWDAAFPFVYDRYTSGPVCIGAPYCGPPNGTENVYVFQWGNYGRDPVRPALFRPDRTVSHVEGRDSGQAASRRDQRRRCQVGAA
jgi:hypothetical protein